MLRRTASSPLAAATAAIAALALAPLSGCRGDKAGGPSPAASVAVSPACLPATLREKGRVSSMIASAIGADLCLEADGEATRCFGVSFGGQPFRDLPAPAPTPSASARVRSEAKAVTVCASGGGCRTVTADGYDGADRARVDAKLAAHMPSDASPDGSKVFLVRHEGHDAVQIYGETYEVASSKRLARFELPFDGHVERAFWLGEHVLVVGCVESGPGCSAKLIHPIRGEVGDIDGNFFGIDGAVTALGEDRFAYVTSGGRSVVVRNERGDLIKATEISPGAEEEMGAAVRVAPGGRELVIAYGGPIAGDVVRVDLAAMKVLARTTPTTCK
jgi:hypothetical protein